MRDFLERTDALAEKLGISLRILAPVMDISVASLFGYRNGSIPVSKKAWSKLERSEIAAGLHPPVDDIAESSINPNNTAPPKDSFSDPRFLAVQAQLAALQAQLSPATRDFSLEDLIARMKAAGAWPPSPADGKLTPGQLLSKYPAHSEKTSSPAPGKKAQ